MLSGLGGREPLDKRAWRRHSKSAEPAMKCLWLRHAACEKHACAESLVKLHLRSLFVVIISISLNRRFSRDPSVVHCCLPSQDLAQTKSCTTLASLTSPYKPGTDRACSTPHTPLSTHFVHILYLLPNNILRVGFTSTFRYQSRALNSPPSRKLPQRAQ